MSQGTAGPTPPSAILKVRALKTWFPVRSGILQRTTGHVRAVDGVDLDLFEGETLGLVGESGCGKTTLGRSITRLIEPSSGTVEFRGRNILGADAKAMRRLRRQIAMIFQDPFASLDPRQTVGEIIGEPLVIHGMFKDQSKRRERIRELLHMVGLSGGFSDHYPHEFSGGQRQRIGIARALAVEPEVVVCDEPISALDVSIQAQIINLLERLQRELHLTYLFIAHDLSVVRHISTRIAVMYLGKIVEVASAEELYRQPRHPYTASLLSAVPVPDPSVARRSRVVLAGDAPSATNPPTGCRFRTRCFKVQPSCAEKEPALDTYQQDGHRAACFFPVGLEVAER